MASEDDRPSERARAARQPERTRPGEQGPPIAGVNRSGRPADG
jgi:hypothetical protein